jgi:hypothetical protein
MMIPSLPRASIALALCVLLAVPAFPQQGIGNLGDLSGIGPSKGEVVAIIVGMVVVLVGVGFLVYHETHKHPSITGCVLSGADGLILQNDKDKKIYALSGDSATLKAGERVTVKGKKQKDSSGKVSFQVEKLTKDFGTCAP